MAVEAGRLRKAFGRGLTVDGGGGTVRATRLGDIDYKQWTDNDECVFRYTHTHTSSHRTLEKHGETEREERRESLLH